jgi:hypothetical protein
MPEDCSSAQVRLDISVMWRQQIYNLLVRFPFAARIAHLRRIIGKVDDDVKERFVRPKAGALPAKQTFVVRESGPQFVAQ